MSTAPGTPAKSPVVWWRSRRTWGLLVGAGAALLATPILAVNAPQDVRVPPLVERKSPAPARFSHWRHNAASCFNCHPGLFPQSPEGFTHKEMQAGLRCGACHDGQVAKAVKAMRCEECHASP